MTTLAYDHTKKQIAIDSRITSNGTIRTDSYNKIIRNEIGVWFFTGKCCDEELLSTLKHDDRVEVAPDVTALLIHDKKVYLVLVNEEGYCEWFEVNHDCAYGSGQDFALAALDFGKSAEDAVKYAMTRDIYTGGDIQVANV
jgi:hypothetical protein